MPRIVLTGNRPRLLEGGSGWHYGVALEVHHPVQPRDRQQPQDARLRVHQDQPSTLGMGPPVQPDQDTETNRIDDVDGRAVKD
jgi:hypothetical protein